MDPVAAPDEPDGPGWFVHTELVLPLRLRRWSGSPNGQKKNHQRRLWARDGHGERIGYVLNERYVYLLPGWEPLRPDVSDALLRAGVTLVAPSAAEQRLVTTRDSLTAYPYADSEPVDVYDESPSVYDASDHRQIARFYRSTGRLDVLYQEDRPDVVALLQRTGLVALRRTPRAFVGTADRPTLAQIAFQQAELDAQYLDQCHVKFAELDQLLHYRIADLTRQGGRKARQSPRPLRAVARHSWDWSGWSERCVFSGSTAVLPELLRPRVDGWLRVYHQARHPYDADDAAYRSANPMWVGWIDRAWWPPRLRGRGSWRDKSRSDIRSVKAGPLPWPADIDTWVDMLIDRHNSFFPLVAGYRAQHRYPELWAAARTHWLNRGSPDSWWGGTEQDQVAGFVGAALWNHTQTRRTWDELDEVACPVCNERFSPKSRFGSWRSVMGCIGARCVRRWRRRCLHHARRIGLDRDRRSMRGRRSSTPGWWPTRTYRVSSAIPPGGSGSGWSSSTARCWPR